MTKLLVLSDSHGGRAAIERVLLKENANIDALVFLGDGLRDLEQAAQRAFALTIEGFSASAAAKAAAQGTAYSKSEVYKQLLLLQQTAE